MIANPVPWPNGARCAAAITFDMDADSLIHLEHPVDSISRVSGISMLRYGPEVAVPRIVETYKRFGIKQTFFVPAWCIEQYPKAIETMLEGGRRPIGCCVRSRSSNAPRASARAAGARRCIISPTTPPICWWKRASSTTPR
jgi:hypothetical protein